MAKDWEPSAAIMVVATDANAVESNIGMQGKSCLSEYRILSIAILFADVAYLVATQHHMNEN